MKIRAFRTFELVFLGLFSISIQTVASPLIVAGLPEPPYKMIVDNKPTGIDIRVLEKVLDELEIEHEFLLLNSGRRMLQLASNGQADVAMSLSYNTDRAEYLDYPERSYKNVSWHFFIRQEDVGRISYDTLSDLVPWRMGAIQSWAYTPEFWEQPFNLTLITDHRLFLNMLVHDRIDVVPMSTVDTLLMIKERNMESQLTYLPKPLISRPYYNAFSKQSDHPDMPLLRAEYDRVVEELIASGFIDDLYREYLGRTIEIDQPSP